MAARGRSRSAGAAPSGASYGSRTPKRDALAKNVDNYSTVGLSKESHPFAISHTTAFHDVLQSHIDELSSRFNAAKPEKKDQEETGSTEWSRMAPRFRAHITAANAELRNSLEAHKDGFADPTGGAHHTANESYRRAIVHLADAHKFILSEQGAGPRPERDKTTGKVITDEAGQPKFARAKMGKLGYQILTDKVGEVHDQHLPTPGDLGKLADDYQSHVRSSAAKLPKGVPSGTMSHGPMKISFNGEPSEESRRTLGAAGFKLTAEEEIQSKARDREISARKSSIQAQETAKKRGYTHTVDESGTPSLQRTKNPFEGVGITGRGALTRAVAQHFEKNYPGQSYIGSQAHMDPVGYASKHNVDLPSQEAMIGKTLNLMGERQISASAVMSPTRDTDPSQTTDSSGTKEIAPSSGRRAAFHSQTGQGGN